jgi:transitional endoplasmic reticulum ATPase
VPSIDEATLRRALRTVQGRAGSLPPDTPSLEALTLVPAQRTQLESLARRMRHAAQIEARGGSVPTGVLFAGPPGTGKTLAARALARSSECAFLSTCGADLVADSERVDRLLRDARDMRPCIVFIDEADDVLGQRQNAVPAVALLTNKLLTAMDGAGGANRDVLWIAATNHPEHLDAAVLRRLVEKLSFMPPDADALEGFISNWLAKKPMVRLARGLNPANLAAALQGLSIAHTQEVLQQAVNAAIAGAPTVFVDGCAQATQIGQAHFTAAWRTVLGGAAPWEQSGPGKKERGRP